MACEHDIVSQNNILDYASISTQQKKKNGAVPPVVVLVS